MPTKKPLSFEGVHQFLRTLFADDLHAKRVLSLAGATLGVIESASLAVAMIGQGLALARGRLTKHAVKQVDRLLSNPGIDVDALLVHWVPYVVGSRSDITVAMDWTDFDACGQTTIMLSLLCRHGRATPLVWLTVDTATLKDRRNAYEDQVLMRLAEVLPASVRVRIVADRGFGDQKLYRMLTDELKFDFVIRFRGNIKVTAADGEARPAAEWVGAGGTRTRAARRHGHRRRLSGRHRGVHTGQGHEAALVPGHQRHQRDRPGTGQSLRQALGHRGRVPRHQGPALRHGDGRDTRQHPRPTRPPVADQRVCGRPAYPTRRGRRSARL